MSGIDWSTVLANLGTFVIAVASLFGLFWGVIRRTTRSLISENAVSAKVYREEQNQIRADIEDLKKSDAEFRVIKSQIESVQRAQSELKTDMQRGLGEVQQDIKESADRQSKELNGAIDRVQRTMVEYTRAVAGK
jgi:F0F1-type ATP synthase membrane subunit b/b'